MASSATHCRHQTTTLSRTREHQIATWQTNQTDIDYHVPKGQAAALFVLGTQNTDDTLILGETQFSDREEAKLKFTAKPKEHLTTNKSISFNGCILSLHEDGSIDLCQKGQGNKIELINAKSDDSKQIYVEQRARGAYLASICQPEACFDLSVAAQRQDPSVDDIIKLNKRLNWQKRNIKRGLKNIVLSISSAKLFVFVDGSFANNIDLSSQIGFVIVLANEEPQEDYKFTLKGNIVHYSSNKAKRVTRSVLASEILGMVAGADIAFAISTTLKNDNRSIKTSADSYYCLHGFLLSI
ncbi:hypothetical protein K3495_g11256 [Podosphaera aphanis]|nr:hypothetical protein K3495_g11256 [Podosphaera aphanis]